MQRMTCLLLLAAVLSFAAMNAAYDPLPGDNAEECERHNAGEIYACSACCILLGKADDFQTLYDMSLSAWQDDLCVCSVDPLAQAPAPEEIVIYERIANGETDEADANELISRHRARIRKID
jgi:hypothetical protein